MTHSADNPQPWQGQPGVPPPPPPGGAYPPPPPQPYAGGGYGGPPVAPKNGLGITALILAILGLLACWIPIVGIVGGVLGLIAIVLGFLGRGRAKRGEATNGGVAMAGIILGFLAVLACIAVTVLSVFFWNKLGFGDLTSCLKDAGNDQNKVQECQDQFQKDLEDNLSITITVTPTP